MAYYVISDDEATKADSLSGLCDAQDSPAENDVSYDAGV